MPSNPCDPRGPWGPRHVQSTSVYLTAKPPERSDITNGIATPGYVHPFSAPWSPSSEQNTEAGTVEGPYTGSGADTVEEITACHLWV